MKNINKREPAPRQGRLNCSPNDSNLGYEQQLKIDFKSLAERIRSHIPALVPGLLPNGRFERHEYVALNPTRADRNLGSFRINTRNGKWADFATGDKGGDLISLWAYVKGIKQIEAACELLDIVGGAYE